jgi:acetyl-CoA synthetase
VPIRDHHGQTELGMVVLNGWHPEIRRDLKPGSMGYTMPGHNVIVMLDDRDEPAPQRKAESDTERGSS